MFDLDLSKLILFGAVALVVVGPKDLPAALRSAGRILRTFQRLRADARKGMDTFMADGSIDREIAILRESTRSYLALNPATAMRGSLPASGQNLGQAPTAPEAIEYASPEMQAYLAPPAEAETTPLPN